MKTFEVKFRFQDRTETAVESAVKVDASSLPGGIAKATREVREEASTESRNST